MLFPHHWPGERVRRWVWGMVHVGQKREKKRGKETTKTLYDKLKSFMDSSLILATDIYFFQNKAFEEV